MKKQEIKEVIMDLRVALIKALNNQVIREYEHLQSRASQAIKSLSLNKLIESEEWFPYVLSTFSVLLGVWIQYYFNIL